MSKNHEQYHIDEVKYGWPTSIVADDGAAGLDRLTEAVAVRRRLSAVTIRLRLRSGRATHQGDGMARRGGGASSARDPRGNRPHGV